MSKKWKYQKKMLNGVRNPPFWKFTGTPPPPFFDKKLPRNDVLFFDFWRFVVSPPWFGDRPPHFWPPYFSILRLKLVLLVYFYTPFQGGTPKSCLFCFQRHFFSVFDPVFIKNWTGVRSKIRAGRHFLFNLHHFSSKIAN
jgi:hypothetical protein